MSEEQINVVPPIDIQQVLDFFADKHVSPLCGSCKKNDWFICRDIDGNIPVLFTLSPELQLMFGPRSIPIIALLCNNCGYIRTYNRQVFVDWIARQGTEEKDD